MNKERLKEILQNVLYYCFEELVDEDIKEWACDMFNMTEEEYDEIFED